MARIQLRDYRISDGRLDDFVAAWLSGVYPLRGRFGFRIDGGWAVPDEDRFIWVLSYDGPGSFEEADAAYYGSAERAALEPDPARWIVESRTIFVDRVAGAATDDR